MRSWLSNLTYVDVHCFPVNKIGPKQVVYGVSVQFYRSLPVTQTNIEYSSDVIRYLKELHGGYDNEKYLLFPGNISEDVILAPVSFNGGTFQLFVELNKTYDTALEWLMDAYSAGLAKFGKHNASPFHEFAHTWNIIVLRSSTDSGKWYHDAICNYYEAIGPRDLWGLQIIYEAQLYQSWDFYKSNIGSTLNKPLYELNPFEGGGYSNQIALMIYSKGMLFYYMLDKEFQSVGKSFSDFVKRLYSTFSSENPGDVDDFMTLANSFTGTDLSDFMNNYLLGNKSYPLSELEAYQASYNSVFGNTGGNTTCGDGL